MPRPPTTCSRGARNWPAASEKAHARRRQLPDRWRHPSDKVCKKIKNFMQREAILSVVFASDRSWRGGHTRPAEGALPRVRRSKINQQRGSVVKTTGDGLLLGSTSLIDP